MLFKKLAPEINLQEIVLEVEAAFRRYEKALVDNDPVVLSELFWSNPLTLRYGEAENLYGADQIAAFRAGRPPGPRPRDLLRVVITTFGTDLATANAEFRNANDVRLGRQSQTWVRFQEGWRIVAAHVSYYESGRL